MALSFMFLALAVLLIGGAPVAVALGGASLIYVFIAGLPPIVMLQNMINGMNSFTLLAVPFFIMAGHLLHHLGVLRERYGVGALTAPAAGLDAR